MTYLEICKYIFSEERVDWELHDFKSRKRELVEAKHISMYLGNWFYPKMSLDEGAGILGLDRSSFYTALRDIKKLLFSDKNLRKRMDKYLNVIGRRMLNERFLKKKK